MLSSSQKIPFSRNSCADLPLQPKAHHPTPGTVESFGHETGCLVLIGLPMTGVGKCPVLGVVYVCKCPVLGILRITLKYFLVIISIISEIRKWLGDVQFRYLPGPVMMFNV